MSDENDIPSDKTVFIPRGVTTPPVAPEPDVPKPDVPKPDVPEPDVPEPEAPAEDAAKKSRTKKADTPIETASDSAWPDLPAEPAVPVEPAPPPAAAYVPPQPAPMPAPQVTSAPQTTEAPKATSFTPMAPRADGDRIQVGDVLNHMFEVRRFIARGGMGEVFEGVNVQSDERVAIKVMLPQLAADPNVQAMFKKEARTLTRLSHPALVQYRVIAQEPQLGVLYIVTEYVDSKNLEDALPSLKPSAADLRTLLRRMADGLRVAHGLGAIHRDISPDNVLLEDGQLSKARIIDFGIAKDLDPTSKTIVGDGFAGKLNYVAPEQLGDFNREVGPWTDVYSLALVILAVAQGKPVNMGGTLVDAVDKRRQGPDLSGAPEELRPLLAAMLTPNPVQRLRSMDEVIAMVDGTSGKISTPTKPAKPAAAAKPAAKPAVKPSVKPAAPEATTGGDSGGLSVAGIRPPMLYYIGGGIAAVLVLGIAGVTMMGGHKAAPQAAAVITPPAPADQEAAARAAIEVVLPKTDCAWLNVTALSADESGVTVALKGVAANAPAVQNTVAHAIEATGLKLAQLNTDSVAPIAPTVCPLLNEYTRIRSSGPPAMSMPQVSWTMQAWPNSPPGVKQARPVINFSVDPTTPDVALYGLETSGVVTPLVSNKKQLSDPTFLQRYTITDRGNGNYQFAPNQNDPGWAGLLLVEGGGPMDEALLKPDIAHRGADWQQKFRAMATQKGWHTDMIWLHAVPG